MELVITKENSIETQKAIGYRIKNNGEEKIMWLPKSMISLSHNYKLFESGTSEILSIPDWLYDKKIDELF